MEVHVLLYSIRQAHALIHLLTHVVYDVYAHMIFYNSLKATCFGYWTSCQVQSSPWLITAASLLFFLSVVGQSFITVYLRHARTVPKLCVGQTPAETDRGTTVSSVNKRQCDLLLDGQVPHHYLGDLPTRIPCVSAVKTCSFWNFFFNVQYIYRFDYGVYKNAPLCWLWFRKIPHFV